MTDKINKVVECKRSFVVTDCFHVEHAIKAVLSAHFKDWSFTGLSSHYAFYYFNDSDINLKAVRASNDSYIVLEY